MRAHATRRRACNGSPPRWTAAPNRGGSNGSPPARRTTSSEGSGRSFGSDTQSNDQSRRPAEGADPGQSATGGVLIPSMVAKQPGESDAGAIGNVSASALRSPALLAPADPAAVRVAACHEPPAFLPRPAQERFGRSCGVAAASTAAGRMTSRSRLAPVRNNRGGGARSQERAGRHMPGSCVTGGESAAPQFSSREGVAEPGTPNSQRNRVRHVALKAGVAPGPRETQPRRRAVRALTRCGESGPAVTHGLPRRRDHFSGRAAG